MRKSSVLQWNRLLLIALYKQQQLYMRSMSQSYSILLDKLSSTHAAHERETQLSKDW